ncbi:UNVERIFIED_CONTAM: hypothetical protein FKN15_039691 [Acipenser sinensis]
MWASGAAKNCKQTAGDNESEGEGIPEASESAAEPESQVAGPSTSSAADKVGVRENEVFQSGLVVSNVTVDKESDVQGPSEIDTAVREAGSRAYVLLSLSQQDGIEQHMDFDNRYTLLELFAETTSSEEHGISFEGIHLPQIPGKLLFSLVKRYLCVTSLMDKLNTSGTDQNAERSDCASSSHQTEQSRVQREFEFTMAMANLISELVRVMGWDRNRQAEYASVLNSIEEEQQKVIRSIFQPRSTPCQTVLAAAAPKKKTGNGFKTRTDFASRTAYVEYIQENLKSGMMVRMLEDYEEVSSGDEGEFRYSNDGTPPVQVYWNSLSRTYWVHWHMIEITASCTSGQAEKEAQEKASSLAETLKLNTVSQTFFNKPPGGLYSLPYLAESVREDTGTLSRAEWWEVLFFIKKLEPKQQQEVNNIIRQNLDDQMSEIDDATLIQLSVPVEVAQKLLQYLTQHSQTASLSDLQSSHVYINHYLRKGGLEQERLTGILNSMEYGDEGSSFFLGSLVSLSKKPKKEIVSDSASSASAKPESELPKDDELKFPEDLVFYYYYYFKQCSIQGKKNYLEKFGEVIDIMKKNSSDVGQQLAGLKFITKILEEDGTQEKIMLRTDSAQTIREKLLKMLVEMLITESKEKVVSALRLVHALMLKYEWRVMFATEGGVKAILTCMQEHSSCAQVQQAALAALKVVTGASKHDIRSFTSCFPLSESGAQMMLEIFASIGSATPEGSKGLLSAIPAAIDLMLNTQGTLNKFLDNYQEDVLPWHESIEPCLSSMTAHIGDREVVQLFIRFLHRLATTNKDYAVVMCRLGTKEALIKALDKHSTNLLLVTELRDLISDCEKYASLYKKMTTSILAGCIQKVVTNENVDRRTSSRRTTSAAPNEPEKKDNITVSPLSWLLNEYLEKSEIAKRCKSRAAVFNSRVRRLTHLLVHVDTSQVDTEELKPPVKSNGKEGKNKEATSVLSATRPKVKKASSIAGIAQCWQWVVQQQVKKFLDSSAYSVADFVERYRNLYLRLKNAMEELFGQQTAFVLALRQGFSAALLQLSILTAMHVSERFAQHIDLMIQESGTDCGNMEKLNQLQQFMEPMLFLSGLELANTFEHFYRYYLGDRLLGQGKVWLERAVIEQIGTCFPNRFPQQMLKNLSESEDLQQEFHLYRLQQLDKTLQDLDEEMMEDQSSCPEDESEVKVLVLSPRCWVISSFCYLENPKKYFPSPLCNYLGEFSEFYTNNGKEGKNKEATSVLSATRPKVKKASSIAGIAQCWQWVVQQQVKKFLDSSAYSVADFVERYRNLYLRLKNAMEELFGQQTAFVLALRQGFSAALLQLSILTAMHVSERFAQHIDLMIQESGTDCGNMEKLNQLQQFMEPMLFLSGLELANTFEHFYRFAELVTTCKGVLSLNEETLIRGNEEHSYCCLLPKQTYLNVDEDATSTLERKRNFIYCLIIQIMKAEKELHMDNLVFRVIDVCQKQESRTSPLLMRFSCSNTDVLSCIMHLLNKGYIRRNEDSPHILEFVPEDPTTPQKGQAHFTFTKPDMKKSNSCNKGNVSPFSVDSFSPAPQSSEDGVLETVLFSMGRTMTRDEVRQLMNQTVGQVADTLTISSDQAQHLLVHCKWNVDLLIQRYAEDSDSMLLASGMQGKNPQPPPSPVTNCPVCLSQQSGEHVVTPTLSCMHYCCRTCWKDYLTSRIEQNLVLNCTCPISDCPAQPTTEFISSVINDKDVLAKYENTLLRGYVECCSNLTWCTNPQGCDQILCKQGIGSVGTCSKCCWSSCFSCNFPEAHYPASCSHMSQWMDDGGYYEGMSMEAQSKHLAQLISKRCPSCQAQIEKNEGCLHMTCAKCNHGFCWRCLKSWKPTHKDYYNCAAMVSKAARQEKKFQDYNERCIFQSQAKDFAINLENKVSAINEALQMKSLTFVIDACKILAQSRKVLAYSCAYSYYNQDTEKMDIMEQQTETLELHTNALQILLEETLLQCTDLASCIRLLKPEHLNTGLELIRRIQERLVAILQHSAQVLAYSCVYSYYNQDTEKMDIMEQQTETLELHTNALQILLEETLLQCTDLASCIRLLKPEHLNTGLELIRRIQERLVAILQHSAQDFQVGYQSKTGADQEVAQSSNIANQSDSNKE